MAKVFGFECLRKTLERRVSGSLGGHKIARRHYGVTAGARKPEAHERESREREIVQLPEPEPSVLTIIGGSGNYEGITGTIGSTPVEDRARFRY